MAQLDTDDVARLLREYGQRSAMRGGNPYRAKAYATAAENLSALAEPLDDVIKAGDLKSIPGIGDAIADIITTMHKTGTHPKLEEMRKEVPEALLPLLEIPRVRAEDVAKIHAEGFKDIPSLEKALASGRLNGVKGFTPSFQKKILDGLKIRQESAGKLHIHRAENLLLEAKKRLVTARPDILEVIVAGDFRRQCELVGDFSLVAVMKDSKKPAPKLGGKIKLHIATKDNKGSVLLFATGNAAHLDELAALARKKGMVLTAEGLAKKGKVVAAAEETDIYKALGLPYIEPELREGRGEIARAKKQPALVELKDIRGILHSHTTQSDGIHTLEEMSQAVKDRGFQYFGVCDHSQTAHYAGGLKADEITEQHKDVDRLNKKIGGKNFHIFKGIESDILVDGSLDYPDAVLKRFDFIVASVHGQFKTERAVQTARIIKAIRNPYTTILGHMTGRQLLRRPGYEVDVEAILKACAEEGVAVEINANPWRLDLDWRWHQFALEAGCLMSINPDAHSTDEIDLVRWGVAMARKGGVPTGRVLNCFTLAQFTKHLAARRRRH